MHRGARGNVCGKYLKRSRLSSAWNGTTTLRQRLDESQRPTYRAFGLCLPLRGEWEQRGILIVDKPLNMCIIILFRCCIIIGRIVGSRITEDYQRVNLPSWIIWDIGSSRRLQGRTSDIQDEPTASNANQATPENCYNMEGFNLLKLSGLGCPEMKETYRYNKRQRQGNKHIK